MGQKWEEIADNDKIHTNKLQNYQSSIRKKILHRRSHNTITKYNYPYSKKI